MTRWAASRDPILQRYGVGALARLAGGGAACFEVVRGAGGLAALVAALTCADPQTQCFAAGALGARAGLGPAVAGAAVAPRCGGCFGSCGYVAAMSHPRRGSPGRTGSRGLPAPMRTRRTIT
jgi:hypothetical protein